MEQVYLVARQTGAYDDFREEVLFFVETLDVAILLSEQAHDEWYGAIERFPIDDNYCGENWDEVEESLFSKRRMFLTIDPTVDVSDRIEPTYIMRTVRSFRAY